MALFGGARDMSMFRSVNKEIINKVIDVEVLFYKLDLNNTKTNLYEESPKKYYYTPILVHCLVAKDDQAWNSDDYGPDVTQPVTLAFLKDELIDLDVVPEVGDIIEHHASLYEIDSIVDNQNFVGKNPASWFGGDSHGYSISIICQAHMTRPSKLNIIETRFGNSVTNQDNITLPRNV